MKPFAMPSAAAARATALDLLPAERTIDARLGKARSGGLWPRLAGNRGVTRQCSDGIDPAP